MNRFPTIRALSVPRAAMLAGLAVAALLDSASAKAEGIPFHAEARVNQFSSALEDWHDSGQTASVTLDHVLNPGHETAEFHFKANVSIDGSRPQGLIRMSAEMDRAYDPDKEHMQSARGVGYWNDQVILTDHPDPPDHLALTLGLDGHFSGSSASDRRSAASVVLGVYTLGTSREFRQVQSVNFGGLDMVELRRSWVSARPDRNEVWIDHSSVDAWDHYDGPTTLAGNSFAFFFESGMIVNIPLDRVEAGVAYYPFQIRMEGGAGSTGGVAAADLEHSLTLDNLTMTDGSPLDPQMWSFQSGTTLIPEPATAALLALGGLTLLRRRTR